MSAEDPRAVVERALGRARNGGAHQADALLVESTSTEVRVRADEVDFVKQAQERALGIRVLISGAKGRSTAVTSTSDLSPEAVERMADETVALARATAPDPTAGLPEGDFAEALPNLDLADPPGDAVSLEARIDAARAAEAAARETDPRVVNSEGAEVDSARSRVTYGNSAGFLGGYEATSHGVSCMPVVAQDGAMQTDWWMSAARHWSALDDPAAVGRRAAERALRRLGARRVATCEVPVIFEASVARSLLGHLVGCVSGYAVYRGTSFLAKRMGEPIGSEQVTIVDDGRRPAGLGSKPFDGEGLATRRNLVVEQGRLASWILDTYAGRKLGLPSTGNAARGVGSGPGAAPTNLWLEPGSSSLDELVADTPRGLLVTYLFGQGFNPVTGDLSRGAAGLWIEGGRISHPVEEITIAGNLGDVLRDVDAVADDLLWLGRVATPSLRVRRMTVGGE